MIHHKLIITDKVNMLINTSRFSKIELSDMIGISRPTLDNRLANNSWKKGEIEIIKKI
jgi:predicted XRE-type DNA-binding protein